MRGFSTNVVRPARPAIDTEVLLYVLGGMLGLGTLRTVEKAKGVQ